MKYFFSNWQTRNNNLHQLTIESKASIKTTHIIGYGCGVTLTSKHAGWKQDFTCAADELEFYKPSVSK